MMKDPPHPGGTIKEDCIGAEGFTVTEAARRLGVTRPTLSRVINGRGGVSPEMAIRFEKIGWSNAEFWMRLQTNYDLAQARLNEDRINVALPTSSEQQPLSAAHPVHTVLECGRC